MTTEFRTVFETSVAVSAILLPRSVPRRAFDSGDADLLTLHPFQGIAIVTANEFVKTVVV